MQLPDIKDLGKVIDLCRKKGVEEITIGELKLKLGAAPEKQFRSNIGTVEPEHDPSNPWENFPDGELTAEQLTYYSSGGRPGEEPWLNKGES